MIQATALYGSTDANEPQAIGSAFTELKYDLRNYEGKWNVFQVTITGDKGAYYVEFTLKVSDNFNETFGKAEVSEILK